MSEPVPEAQLDDGGSGLRPATEGWFVVNVRDAEWWSTGSRGAQCAFENEYGERPVEFPQVGIHLTVLEPGQTSMYHAEENQEAFLVLSGECVLLSRTRSGGSVRGTSSMLPPGRATASWARATGRARSSWSARDRARASSTPYRKPRCVTARARRRRRPTGGRRTRRSSTSGASGRPGGRGFPGCSR